MVVSRENGVSGAWPLVVEVDHRGGAVLDAPAGLLDPRDVGILAAAFDALAPTIARTCSPRLPPRDEWPELWCEVHAEREAIAAEGGAPDPEAVADLDLRAMVARGDLDPHGVTR